MGAHKAQRTAASVILYAITLAFLGLWLAGWFILEDQGITEQGFYGFLIFFAASLVFLGVRASIYE